jgi:hypothetical protein
VIAISSNRAVRDCDRQDANFGGAATLIGDRIMLSASLGVCQRRVCGSR